MLRISLFECSFCQFDVVFSCVVFACGHVGFVYYAGKDFLVAVVDDAAHVRHAAVADFHVLLVKDGVQIVVWWEVFLDSVVEGFSNVGPDFFAVWVLTR